MRYSISDLEQLSGVQTHTIRIWERRYHALEPMRSAGNTRFYDDSQLRRLLNIASLNQSGLKISQICALTEKEMNELLEQEIAKSASPVADYEYYISQLLKFGIAYDELHFNSLVTRAIKEYGLKNTYLQVIYPLLVRLGLMWRSDNICPAQEHFLSNIIKQKISKAIDDIKQTTKPKSTWVLFLPEDEGHDIGLLFANYLLKLSGQRVIYLGSRVPMESLQDVIQQVKIDYMLFFMVRSRPLANANAYLQEISDSFAGQQILVAGNVKVIGQTPMNNNLRLVESIEDLEEQIKLIEDDK